MKTYYNNICTFVVKLNGFLGATLLLYSCILFACGGGGGGSGTSASSNNIQLSSITVTPTDPTIPLGITQQFTATGTYSDGSTQDITNSVAWNTSNPAIETISNTVGSNGLATPITAGSVVVSASLSGKTGNTNLTVSDWVNVGSPGFSLGKADYTSLVIDSSGVLYVAYADYENLDKATVMKLPQ